MARIDELRLMTKIARMYHELGMRQTEIAQRLNLSQATVSRLFNRAQREGIIRTTVSVPPGIYTELEEELARCYALRDAVVVDAENEESEEIVQRAIGAAAAHYIESTLQMNQVVGLSSWSATLLAMVDAMHQLPRRTDAQVVQILGGIGNPGAEIYASRLLERFARLVNGAATFLPAPGIVGSQQSKEAFLQDAFVRAAQEMFAQVNLALVGIGDVEPSKLLAHSGNAFSPQELTLLRQRGAVGDILVHFFDIEGRPVDSSLDNRVMSMPLHQLRKVDRAIGLAGGRRKFSAILGALRGRWINILITDRFTAERLLEAAGCASQP